MSDNTVRKVSFWRIFFPSLVALLVASIISIFFFFSTLGGFIDKYLGSSSLPNSDLKDKTFLYLQFNEPLGDVGYNRINTSSFSFEKQQGLAEIIYGLEKAKNDDKIKGVFIETGHIETGYGNLFELREALKDFINSGKKVVFYAKGEAITTKTLYLSTVTKDNYIFPESNVEFLGLGAEIMFYKNLLDKFDIEVEVIRGEGNDFKSAVEPFFRTEMSDSSRYQTERFMNGIWNRILTDIAKDKNLTVSKLNDLASNAQVLNGRNAAQNGIFSATKYRDEVLTLLKQYAGTDKDSEVNLYSFDKYARNVYREEMKNQEKKDAIALIFAEGDIATDGNGIASTTLCKHIREARTDDKIKTIVLRVNSPGGSALASEEIWREVDLASKKKKVYVSMGNLAASGGYYISSAADRIFADPTTITGSIGVFGVIPNFGTALNKHLGVTFDGVKTNQFANISLMRKMTPQELAIIQSGVNDIYSQFIKRVSDGRKLPQERVKQIAKGRVWLGSDAINQGLVDEFGGLTATLNYAKKQVGNLPVVVWPKVQDSDLRDIMDLFREQNATVEEESKVSDEVLNYYKEIKKLENKFGIQMRMPFELKL
jgi:protease-4